jgi:hypothetical protein
MLIVLLTSGVCQTLDLPAVNGKAATVVMCPAPAASLPASGTAERSGANRPVDQGAMPKGDSSGASPIRDRRFSDGLG